MGKLITLNEAVDRLGVSRQTLSNWIDRGVINAKKMSKNKKGLWLDEDTIKALLDDAIHIDRTKALVEEQRRELDELNIELNKKITSIRNEVIGIDRTGKFLYAVHFYEALPCMFFELGLINEREKCIMQSVIYGNSLEQISREFGISRERVRQIFMKAIRKSSCLSRIREKLDELERTKKELEDAKIAIKELMHYKEEELKKINNEDVEELSDDYNELLKLLDRRLVDCDLSVRAINTLTSIGCNTVGDIVKLQKKDMLRIRNCGKKTVTKVGDFLYANNLTFGMDIEHLRQMKVNLILKSME